MNTPAKNRLVNQRTSSDCGLACMATIAEICYEEVMKKFLELGLYAKHKKTFPYSTNFKDVKEVMDKLGYSGTIKRFNSLEEINGPSILKIPTAKKTMWHWVVAIPHEEHKLLIYDPCYEVISYYTNPPLDEGYIHISHFKPQGSYIEFKQKIKPREKE